MFERYSERARRTIFYARDEALNRFSREIEPRDIVLGLTHDAHQPGCPFAKLHENAADLRALLSPEPRLCGPPHNWEIPLSREGKMVLAYADQESKRDGRYTIGSHHLLRSVLHLGGQTANKLIESGYSLSAVRQASKELYRSAPDAAVSTGSRLSLLRWRVRRYGLRLLIFAALILVTADLLYVQWHP